MAGEMDLKKILKEMKPKLNEGEYVFCSVGNRSRVDSQKILFFFKEEEGTTIVVRKEWADRLKLEYSFVAAWITLSVHSALEAVGLTAAFSAALAEKGISCNVVSGFYHDHLFVSTKDVVQAMSILSNVR